MLFLKSVMARVLYNFYLEPVDEVADINFVLGVTLMPNHPIHAKFVKIDRE